MSDNPVVMVPVAWWVNGEMEWRYIPAEILRVIHDRNWKSRYEVQSLLTFEVFTIDPVVLEYDAED